MHGHASTVSWEGHREAQWDTWAQCQQYAASQTRHSHENTTMYWNKSVERLCNVLNDKYARMDEQCVCFPSYQVAKRCREWIRTQVRDSAANVKIRILQLSTSKPVNADELAWRKECKIAVVFVRKIWYPILFQYWQMTGEIISKNVADYVLHELFIIEKSHKTVHDSTKHNDANRDKEVEEIDFIESRFGRTIDFTLDDKAKRLIKKRIITKVVDDEHTGEDEMTNSLHSVNNSIMDLMSLRAFEDSDDDELVNDDDPIRSLIPPEPINANMETQADDTDIDVIIDTNNNTTNNNNPFIHNANLNPDKDVYLFPTELNPIHISHKLLLSLDSQRINRSRNGSNYNLINGVPNDKIPFKKTVVLGYIDPIRLQLLESFNTIYYINGTSGEAMINLKKILHSGEQILAVYLDIPNCYSLTTINLYDLKSLSELFGFHIVVNDSNSNMINVDIMSCCDMICGSLSKIFATDTNLPETTNGTNSNDEDGMINCGALILNPMSKIYPFMINFMLHEYEDNLWCEDAIQLERNSRDFIVHNNRINSNALNLVNKIFVPQLNQGNLTMVQYPSMVDTEVYNMVKCKKYGGYGSLINIRFANEASLQKFYDNIPIAKGPQLTTIRTTICPHIILQDTEEDKCTLRISVGLEPYHTLQKIFEQSFA